MTKKLIKISIYVTCSLFIIVCVLSYLNSNIIPLKVVTTVASAAEILVVLYCKFLWKIKFLNFFKKKNLNGKWDCNIIYDAGNVYDAGEKNCVLIIKQDLFDIQVNMDTDEIKSYSIAATLLKSHENTSLYYVYKTEPSKDNREKNPDKWGTAKLDIKDDNMDGEYWTNGKTAGRMIARKVKNISQ